MNNQSPTRSNDVILHQLLKLIPRGMVGRIARETGIDAKARSFSVLSHLSQWGHSFTRLFTVSRSALWERLDLLGLLKSYGTASGRLKVLGALNCAWLPGFEPVRV